MVMVVMVFRLVWGLCLASIASIATFVFRCKAFSGGKDFKETLTDAANVSKEFAQTVGRVTSATVKNGCVNEIKKRNRSAKRYRKHLLWLKETKQVEALMKSEG